MDEFNIAEFIAARLITGITKEMGYDLPEERITRIASQAIRIQQEHCGGEASIASLGAAIDIDFLLYGDPKAPVPEFHGFDNILNEIYADS